MTEQQPDQRIDVKKFDLITFEVPVGFSKPPAPSPSVAVVSSAFFSLFRMKHGQTRPEQPRRLSNRIDPTLALAWTVERRGCLTRPELRPLLLPSPFFGTHPD